MGGRFLSVLESMPISSIRVTYLVDKSYGLTFYGGYIPILICTLFFIKGFVFTKDAFLKLFSMFAVFFHLGYGLGRLACHFSADGCYGKITFSKLGIRYTWGERQTIFPVHPTPLYEMVINLALFVLFLIAYFKYEKFTLIIFLSFIIFPISRFFIEFLRTNEIVKWGLTLNQFISLLIIPFQILLFIIILKSFKNENHIGSRDCLYFANV